MIELIPAIDIIDGKCVRLSQGDYDSKKVYNENPVEVAKELEAHGIRRLHVVDLDGAVSHHVVNYRTLEQIASRTSLVIDFGGGVKSDEDLVIAFESGAQMVTGGSIAVKNPERFCHWLQTYGSERIILGADVKDHKIAVNGWKDESACELFPFLEDYVGKGVRRHGSRGVQSQTLSERQFERGGSRLYRRVHQEHSGYYRRRHHNQRAQPRKGGFAGI